MGINQYLINPVISIATAMAFVVQQGTTRDLQGPSALRRRTLLLQALVFLALAVSWPFRFKLPQDLARDDNWWLANEWYPLVGWTCINNAVIAVGQGILLYTMSGGSHDEAQPDIEREALLTP